MNDVSNLIDINKRKGFPRSYKFKQWMRWVTIILAMLVIAYSIWLIFNKIDSDSSKFKQFIPFAILFLALNSILKNIFTLNSIVFKKEKIIFRYLGKKNTAIEWSLIKKIALNDGKRKMIELIYFRNGKDAIFEFPITFPNMLEIVNSIVEMIPNAEVDEFIGNVVISDKEKNSILKK